MDVRLSPLASYPWTSSAEPCSHDLSGSRVCRGCQRAPARSSAEPRPPQLAQRDPQRRMNRNAPQTRSRPLQASRRRDKPSILAFHFQAPQDAPGVCRRFADVCLRSPRVQRSPIRLYAKARFVQVPGDSRVDLRAARTLYSARRQGCIHSVPVVPITALSPTPTPGNCLAKGRRIGAVRVPAAATRQHAHRLALALHSLLSPECTSPSDHRGRRPRGSRLPPGESAVCRVYLEIQGSRP